MAEARNPSAPATRPARGTTRGGPWHRPQLLNLVSEGLLLFAAVGLGWALVSWALSKSLFPLRELALNVPPTQVTQAQLEYVARTAIQGNFFTARLEDVRAAFEKLPWVRHAEVRRRWPDVLELHLEEHEAVAYWKNTGNNDGDVRLLNRQGEIFTASSDARMPELSGPQGTAATVLERFETYSKILRPLGLNPARLELSARGAWELRTEEDFIVMLGREQERSPIEARLSNFASAWPRLRDELGVRIVRADLRYPNGFALTPESHKR